jgi:hypothetical protein
MESFELQGGEKKTHTLYFDFSNNRDALSWTDGPSEAIITPDTYIAAKAIPYLSPSSRLSSLVNVSIEGKNSFLSKRIDIDEFGWRNFGELFADHESLYQKADEPSLISHYNNQYDPIYGFARQYLSTGQKEWFELMNDLAKHVLDIDIYYTSKDRVEYNGGLFWHTDHYLDAHTSTHRTFSRLNNSSSTAGQTGGGPGAEHCYTSGLMYHYYLTGDQASKNAVIQLAQWMINTHEGSPTILGQLLSIKKNEFKKLVEFLRRKPLNPHKYPLTRGTGNYITALLDAYALTDDRDYLNKAGDVILKTIHPKDNINQRNFSDIEGTWSYTILLQSLFKFLENKEVLNEFDQNYDYTKQAAIHYSKWIMNNETPYLSNVSVLEYPNDTWAAQDLRKSNILFQAAQYDVENRKKLLQAAIEFENHTYHTLINSKTIHFTRIQCILLQNIGPNNATITDKHRQEKYTFNYPKRPPFGSMAKSSLKKIISAIANFSINNEIQWLKNRLL